MSALLSLKQVSVQMKGASQAILQKVDLEILPGEILTVIGPNGAGKTTLVRVVLGLMNFSGQRTLKPKLRIGYMPQKLALNPQLPLTVKRFLQLGFSQVSFFNARSASDKQIHFRAEQVGIHKILSQAIQSVSGGELQRVLLARALLTNPDLLVLDEPAQGVDVHGQAEMYQLIHQIKTEQGCGVLMVSHDLHWVMAQTDKVVCLNQHICCHGHPDHISNDPAFIELFGADVSNNLASYTHHHDHQHDLHGDVLGEDHNGDNNQDKNCNH